MHNQSEVLCHETILDCLNHTVFEVMHESFQELIVVDRGTVKQTASPCEDTSDRIGGSLLALLPQSVMPCDSAMSSFRFDCSVGRNQDRGHQPQRPKSLIIKDLP